MKRILPLFFALTLTVAPLAGCAPTIDTRGNLLETYQLQEIIPGQDTKENVTAKIGSPTTVSPFDQNIWYYMGQRTAKTAMLDPKIKRERIIVVSFANDGYVDKVVERRDGRQDVPIVARKTPTTGNDFTIMQQLMGNLGRFNAPKQSASQTATGGK